MLICSNSILCPSPWSYSWVNVLADSKKQELVEPVHETENASLVELAEAPPQRCFFATHRKKLVKSFFTPAQDILQFPLQYQPRLEPG